MTRDYLIELLDAYWFAPPVALWRAVELRAVDELQYRRPLLDLGCGDGLIGQILFGSERQADVGLDPWMGQLRKAAEVGVYRHVDQGLGHALPYVDGFFSTVFSNSVLEHIPDVRPVIREVSRVLSPQGQFIFTVPSDAFRCMLDGYAARMEAEDPEGAEAYARAIDEHLEHYHYYTPQEWEDLLSAAGMRLIGADYYMPPEVERLWDQMAKRFRAQGRLSLWEMAVSPRLRVLGYQRILRRAVVRYLGRRWRPYYEKRVQSGAKGGGLLIVAQRKE